MSKYVKYSGKQLRNQEMLLAALNACGYGPSVVEVHAQPVTLYGYHGDARPEKANIVIRRNNTGVGSSNDIGFLRQEDGSFAPIVSQYDSAAIHIVDGKPMGSLLAKNKGLQGTTFVDGVNKAYRMLAKDKAVSTILLKTIPGLKAKGTIPKNATVVKQAVGTTTRVAVTW